MPAWDDKQISRFSFRNALFARRGLDAAQAEALADRLARRDYERDERRMCVECSHWQRGNTCFKKSPFVRGVLMRCDNFNFRTP